MNLTLDETARLGSFGENQESCRHRIEAVIEEAAIEKLKLVYDGQVNKSRVLSFGQNMMSMFGVQASAKVIAVE